MKIEEKRICSYPLRLDAELSLWVKARAKAEDRSFNAELNRIIRKAKEAEEQKPSEGA
jgi:hypothetical protein